jgi:integrase
MAKDRITKRAVDALRCPPGKDRVFLWDEDLSGFGVVAMPSGKKVYVAQYRQHGRSRRMKLGEHGRLTPDEARKAAKVILGIVEGGTDPIEQRRAKRSEQSFKELADKYSRLHVAAKCKERTAEEYGRMLRLHIFPAIGGKSVGQITKADIARLHTRMLDRPSAANRCLALVDSVWNWAVRSGEITAAPSPTLDLELYPERARDRYLTAAELRRLGQALREAETTGLPWDVDEAGPKAKHLPKANRSRIIDPYGVAAIRLLMLTGARLREILHARWDWVDWERGIIFLPDSKTSRKPLYLSDAALAVLQDITRVDGNPHIFPGEGKGTHRADLKRPWTAIRRAAGLLEEGTEQQPKAKGKKGLGEKSVSAVRPRVRLHDLRHSFASLGVGSSLGLPVVGKLLGHSQARTTSRYAHLDADPLHRAANLIGAQIVAGMKGAVPALPAPGEGAAE